MLAKRIRNCEHIQDTAARNHKELVVQVGCTEPDLWFKLISKFSPPEDVQIFDPILCSLVLIHAFRAFPAKGTVRGVLTTNEPWTLNMRSKISIQL